MLKASQRVFLIILFYAFSCSVLQAQNLTKSPYSRFGVGELAYGGFARNYAMGQLSQGWSSDSYINILNPASYASIKNTSFEMAAIGSVGELRTSTINQSVNNASFGYFGLGFRILKNNRWSGAFGLVPYSSVGYNIESPRTVDTLNAVTRYEGRGGLSRFFIGNGFRLTKNLSFGFNASYVFGQVTTFRGLYFDNGLALNLFNFAEDRDEFIGDFAFDAGLQYRFKVNDNLTATLGLSSNASTNLDAQREVLQRSLRPGSTVSTSDTIFYSDDVKGSINIPVGFIGGFGLEHNDDKRYWMIGADYNQNSWSQYSAFGISDSLQDSYTVSVGGAYIPNINATKSIKRIEYRAGFRFSETNLSINNTSIQEYGISFGLGLPLKKKRAAEEYQSRINLSAEYFVRGTQSNDLIEEQYYRFIIGFTLNDKWFQKRKFE